MLLVVIFISPNFCYGVDMTIDTEDLPKRNYKELKFDPPKDGWEELHTEAQQLTFELVVKKRDLLTQCFNLLNDKFGCGYAGMHRVTLQDEPHSEYLLHVDTGEGYVVRTIWPDLESYSKPFEVRFEVEGVTRPDLIIS